MASGDNCAAAFDQVWRGQLRHSSEDALMNAMTFEKRNPLHRRQACERLAKKRHGVLGLDQAKELGLGQAALTRLVQSGAWKRRYPRVYLMASMPDTFEQRAMAACVWAGPGAVTTHRSAGCLWHMVREAHHDVEVAVPRGGKSRAPIGVRVRQRVLPDQDKTHLGVIPITTPIRTLIDLGDTLSEEEAEVILEESLFRKRVDLYRLQQRALDLAATRCRGAKLMQRLVEQRGHDPACESRLEVAVQRLMRRARLPQPRRQFTIQQNDRFLARVDFAFPEARVAIEADGYKFHAPRDAFERDAVKRNRLQALGWRVIVVTWKRLREDPDGVIKEIEECLGIHRLL
jgi:very-short-patch-repair endonuclease